MVLRLYTIAVLYFINVGNQYEPKKWGQGSYTRMSAREEDPANADKGEGCMTTYADVQTIIVVKQWRN